MHQLRDGSRQPFVDNLSDMGRDIESITKALETRGETALSAEIKAELRRQSFDSDGNALALEGRAQAAVLSCLKIAEKPMDVAWLSAWAVMQALTTKVGHDTWQALPLFAEVKPGVQPDSQDLFLWNLRDPGHADDRAQDKLRKAVVYPAVIRRIIDNPDYTANSHSDRRLDSAPQIREVLLHAAKLYDQQV